jgi:hypothetical protein
MKKTHVVLGIVFLIVSGLISFSTLQSLISGKEKKELVAEITSAKRESEKKEGVERALLFVEELNAIDREIKNEGAILWGRTLLFSAFFISDTKGIDFWNGSID